MVMAGLAGLVFKLETAAVYRGAKHYQMSLKPEGAVQWRKGDHVLFWEGFDINYTELGLRSLIQTKWLMEVGARHEIVIPSSRSEQADIINLPHRGSHILGFVDTKHGIDDRWGNWVSARLLMGSNLYGWQAKVSVGHAFSGHTDNTGTDIVMFSTFADKNNINNYFGVSTSDGVASGLTPIDLDGGYRSSGLTITYRDNMSARIQVTAKAGIEYYSDEISKSDLVGSDTETHAELSVIWVFQ
ncbi:MipA/OmpV family protein [Pseudomonas sp. HK3]